MTDLEHLNPRAFAEQLHTEFRLGSGGEQQISLQLAEVKELPGGPALECFSLIFNGPRTPMLPQQIVRLTHAVLGEMELFITPIGVMPDSARYEVLFNRFRKEAAVAGR